MRTRDELIGFLDPPDPVGAAVALGRPAGGVITWSRATGGDHAHEEVVTYGAGIAAEAVVDRLQEIAAQNRAATAVRLVPAEGDDGRPGSWGVEDLAVAAVARMALPDVVAVRVDWRSVGAAAAQIAAAFGATDWVIPADDTCDPAHLAAAIGCTAKERT